MDAPTLGFVKTTDDDQAHNLLRIKVPLERHRRLEASVAKATTILSQRSYLPMRHYRRDACHIVSTL